MILELPDREFGGYIFDCDGTLVDSMPLHFRAWMASFVHHGAPWHWTEDEFYANAGVPDRITVMVNGAVLTEGTPEAIAADPLVRAVYLGHGESVHGEPVQGEEVGHG